jgi:hypothetical protein
LVKEFTKRKSRTEQVYSGAIKREMAESYAKELSMARKGSEQVLHLSLGHF